MGFRLVPKLVILNDLERHNGRYSALTPKALDFKADRVKRIEACQCCLQRKFSLVLF